MGPTAASWLLSAKNTGLAVPRCSPLSSDRHSGPPKVSRDSPSGQPLPVGAASSTLKCTLLPSSPKPSFTRPHLGSLPRSKPGSKSVSGQLLADHSPESVCGSGLPSLLPQTFSYLHQECFFLPFKSSILLHFQFPNVGLPLPPFQRSLVSHYWSFPVDWVTTVSGTFSLFWVTSSSHLENSTPKQTMTENKSVSFPKYGTWYGTLHYWEIHRHFWLIFLNKCFFVCKYRKSPRTVCHSPRITGTCLDTVNVLMWGELGHCDATLVSPSLAELASTPCLHRNHGICVMVGLFYCFNQRGNAA